MKQFGFGAPFQFPEPSLGPRPRSVAIIVRVMDRADELGVSLPSLLSQDYSDYHVVIVDHSSQDDLPAVLATMPSPRLRVVRCPRPRYFNRARAGNIGVRYSFSDLLFFLDTGMAFRHEHHLSQIVAAFESSPEIEHDHHTRWRREAGYPVLDAQTLVSDESSRFVYSECECYGLHMLVSRGIFQRIGGLNEVLRDWGYEDTDMAARLELCGYGRIAIRELVHSQHSDEHRVRFHQEKFKEQTWARNRRISDGFIEAFGPIIGTQRLPGCCDWVEIDGVSYAGSDAPQQEWTMKTNAELLGERVFSQRLPRTDSGAPLVSVVVPTKNAAEYLIGVLDSVFSQDYPNIECLVVDGGSTDATLDVVASYGDRVTWTSQSDRGAFDAINRGWQASSGEILAWLNADDRWAPGAVSTVVKCFQDDPEADVIYGDCLIIDADGRQLERRRPPDWDLHYSVANCFHMIDQPAAFIHRRMAQRVGWLYPAWFHDWDLWRRVSLAGGKIRRVPHLLGCARVRVGNSQYRPEILVDGLAGLTKRFFSLPAVPSNLRKLKRRALSNCYLRIVENLLDGQPESRTLRRKYLIKASIVDPSNLGNVLKRRPPGPPRPPTSPRKVTVGALAWANLIKTRLTSALLVAPKRWLGGAVARVFTRGNWELHLKLDGLQQRVAAAGELEALRLDAIAADVSGLSDRIEQSRLPVVEALGSLRRQREMRLDAIAADVSGLSDRIEQSRLTVVEALESLRRQHEALQQELEAVQRRPPTVSSTLRDVYGTPPTLRRIPNWTYLGVDPQLDGLLSGRLELWSSLKSPVLMRWFADLLVMIWPGNELSRVLFLTGNFEPNELTWMSQTLTEGMTMIDIGAHMGMYSVIASKLVGGSGVVVALEPSTREFQRLAFHVTLNDLQNVRCVQVAASDSLGEATLRIAWEWNSGHNTFGQFFSPTVEMAREERVRTQTLDALVAAQGLEHVDLIKIDVEGHELRVLAGAVETLTRFRPRVLIEVFEETLRRQGTSEKEVLAFFQRHGYLLHEFSPVTGELVPLSMSESDQSRNMVALPSDPASGEVDR